MMSVQNRMCKVVDVISLEVLSGICLRRRSITTRIVGVSIESEPGIPREEDRGVTT